MSVLKQFRSEFVQQAPGDNPSVGAGERIEVVTDTPLGEKFGEAFVRLE
jgi:hypothetical protein